MDKDDLSKKYLRIAQRIKPEMEGIAKMQQLLNNTGIEDSGVPANKLKFAVINHEFDGQIRIVTPLGHQMGEAEFKKKGTGNLEFNNNTKTVTSLGKKIQRVTRLSMGEE
jgi:hypothetical protein